MNADNDIHHVVWQPSNVWADLTDVCRQYLPEFTATTDTPQQRLSLPDKHKYMERRVAQFVAWQYGICEDDILPFAVPRQTVERCRLVAHALPQAAAPMYILRGLTLRLNKYREQESWLLLQQLLQNSPLLTTVKDSNNITNESSCQPLILVFGDSITQQGFGWPPSTVGWASFLARDYARRADVVNRGFSGTIRNMPSKYLQACLLLPKTRMALIIMMYNNKRYLRQSFLAPMMPPFPATCSMCPWNAMAKTLPPLSTK